MEAGAKVFSILCERFRQRAQVVKGLRCFKSVAPRLQLIKRQQRRAKCKETCWNKILHQLPFSRGAISVRVSINRCSSPVLQVSEAIQYRTFDRTLWMRNARTTD